MTLSQRKQLQRDLNAYLKRFRVPIPFLYIDGEIGDKTNHVIRQVKRCIGYVPSAANSLVTTGFLARLKRPLFRNIVTPVQIARGLAYRRRLRKLNETSYSTPWRGSKAVVDEVDYVFRSRGCYLASVKRTPRQNAAVGGASNSDHLTTNTDSYAKDWGTFSGADDARAAGRHFGFDFDPVGTYNRHTVIRGGHKFSVQILWAVRGHWDHVHVGVDREDIAG